MVPLDAAAAPYVRSWLGPCAEPGLLALRHALAYRRPGIWVDTPWEPRSVILVRDGDGQLEAFGAGEPEPAVGWLVGHHKGFALLAPEPWLDAVRARVGAVEEDGIETWAVGRGRGSASARATAPKVATRRLSAADYPAFSSAVPAWGLRGWRSYSALIEHGAAFGVPYGSGFASMAWVFDQADDYDAVGVYTAPRFRRLGLGRAAASALVDHVISRGRVPLWSTSPGNAPARALARALGFAVAATEPLLRWPPRQSEGFL
jgi:GNAT superfamily N-acetyltransferase